MRALLPLLLALSAQEAPGQEGDAIPVGVPRWAREVVLDGSLLEVLPPDLETALIVRIDSVSPHGTAWRYDFEYYGLEVGSFNLVDYLRREDGSPIAGLAPIPVLFKSGLPPGQVLPHELRSGETPSLGGYLTTLWIFGSQWVLGSLVWLFSSRRSAALERAHESAPAPSIAELLAPLVDRGMAGELPTEEQAQLELMLIAFWRKRLDLESADAGEALQTLKSHDEAGPLLRELERWLHSPDAASEVDPAALLRPYRDLSKSEWDEAAARLAAQQAAD